MKDFLENVKTLIPLIAGIIALAGFYYTTQHRLDVLEDDVATISQQVKRLTKKSPRANKIKRK